jgi:hypothetical protein
MANDAGASWGSPFPSGRPISTDVLDPTTNAHDCLGPLPAEATETVARTLQIVASRFQVQAV